VVALKIREFRNRTSRLFILKWLAAVLEGSRGNRYLRCSNLRKLLICLRKPLDYLYPKGLYCIYYFPKLGILLLKLLLKLGILLLKLGT